MRLSDQELNLTSLARLSELTYKALAAIDYRLVVSVDPEGPHGLSL